jgi:hypothetical protein
VDRDDQPDMFDDITGMARRGDHETSKEAARKVAKEANYLMWCVAYAMLMMKRPVHDYEIRDWCDSYFLPRPESTYRKRRSELFKYGYAEMATLEDGITPAKVMVNGSNRHLWQLTAKGIDLASNEFQGIRPKA